jgi:quinone-modifying oxidoreductase subunit QmoA
MKKSDKPTLVVGGGISGITTAIELAEVGKEVLLIEKLPYLGGRVIQMNNYFPKFCPPACGLEINFNRIRKNRNVTIFTCTELDNISGEEGNFSVRIKISPQFINSSCTACGKCAEVCPVERDNEFNYNLDKTKAAYLPHEMAFPMRYHIDETTCKKESCNLCTDVCEYKAIDLNQKEEYKDFEVSSIVLATGWKPFDYKKLDRLHLNNHPDIVSNVIFERMLAKNGPSEGNLYRLSDNKTPKSIAFIQCAGSRDENYQSHCSAVCCSASIKQALSVIEKYPDIQIDIFYIDLRLSGRNEDLLVKAQKQKNINFIKGKAAKVEKDSDSLMVSAEDILSGKKITKQTDMVVLATGITADNSVCSAMDGCQDVTAFINPGNLKSGIYAVSCAKKPMDVSSSLKDATGTALKALQSTLKVY